MSRSAFRLSRKTRALCACGQRAFYFARHGEGVRFRRDHTLCLRCWRAARSRNAAREMASARARAVHFVPGPFALL